MNMRPPSADCLPVRQPAWASSPFATARMHRTGPSTVRAHHVAPPQIGQGACLVTCRNSSVLAPSMSTPLARSHRVPPRRAPLPQHNWATACTSPPQTRVHSPITLTAERPALPCDPRDAVHFRASCHRSCVSATPRAACASRVFSSIHPNEPRRPQSRALPSGTRCSC